MHTLLVWGLLLVVAAGGAGYAQPVFEIVGIEGNAKIQVANRKHFEVLTSRMRVGDNDIVETFFKSRVILRFGENIVVLGSNSKALFNITGGGARAFEVNSTLFGGGVLVKVVAGAEVSVYTANGVCSFNQGTVSSIVDPQSGESGFQVLGGERVSVRNIAQQKGRVLRAGQTTMVLPGREPTAALYLTNRHVNVLKHFFGDGYVQSELDASSIVPTEEGTGTIGPPQVSQNLLLERHRGAVIDQGMYRKQFTLNEQYEKRFRVDALDWPLYHPVVMSAPLHEGRLEVAARVGAGIASSGVFPQFAVMPRITTPLFGAGLRLRMARAQEVFGMQQYGAGAKGMLDAVDHLRLSLQDSLHTLYLGPLEDYTIQDGFMVRRFTNRPVNSVVQPLGLAVNAELFREVALNAFVGDVSDFSCMGLHLLWESGMYYLGAGYYVDRDQYTPSTASGTERFVALPAVDGFAGQRMVQIAELNLGADMVYSDRGRVRMMVEYAHRLFTGGNGFVVRAPNLTFNVRGMELGATLTMENGKLFINQFHWFYPSNRIRSIDTSSTDAPQRVAVTQHAQLPPNRQVLGASGFFRINPLRGVSVELEARHDFSSKLMFVDSAGNDSMVAGNLSYDFYFAAAINDELIPALAYAKAFVEQVHGGLFPPLGLQSPSSSARTGNYFSSWGMRAGLSVLTMPLVGHIAFELGCSYFFLDTDGRFDGRVTPRDRTLDIYGGVRWGGF